MGHNSLPFPDITETPALLVSVVNIVAWPRWCLDQDFKRNSHRLCGEECFGSDGACLTWIRDVDLGQQRGRCRMNCACGSVLFVVAQVDPLNVILPIAVLLSVRFSLRPTGR
jgi:hypothetical protein